MIRQGLLALSLPFAGSALAEGLTLQFPVDCTLGDTCYIQQYMDRDPGEGDRDYRCNGLSYDGHKGTDFALPTRAEMEKGVNVLAAADGRVRGFRDGMSDSGFTDATAAEIDGKECGNGLVMVHPGGWETQYCHMMNGSLTVTNGQDIRAGDVLGKVGQSGRAEFPHLHLSVRKDGKPVDPFDPDGDVDCASPGDSTLWAETPAYQPGGMIDVGITDRIPEYDEVKAGSADAAVPGRDAAALVVYGFSFGTRKDDVVRLVLTGPEGVVIAKDQVLERDHAQGFRAIGKRLRRGTRWPAGVYTGTAELIRDGQPISDRKVEITLGDAG